MVIFLLFFLRKTTLEPRLIKTSCAKFVDRIIQIIHFYLLRPLSCYKTPQFAC